MGYKKVTKEDVLTAAIRDCSMMMGPYFTTTGWIAKKLETSKYQARKYLKQLVEEGYLKPMSEGGMCDYSFEVYYIRGYRTTDKARETDIYKELQKKDDELWKKCFEGKEKP